MRFHKIEGSHRVMLKVTRAKFFDTLGDKILQLSQLDLPILIVWGREEKSIPLETGLKWSEILGRASFEVIDQAGHCPNLDQPQRFNRLALSFLGES
jgi:pimeloyl-ACP methyl ester carboxylesterase